MKRTYLSLNVFLCTFLFTVPQVLAQFITVGEGSYTTVFPGVDAAGRNTFPSGTPQLSGDAMGKPVPTNDWWSALVKNNHANNLFNYPLAMRTLPAGLDVGYIVPPSLPGGSTQPLSDLSPVIVGVTGLNASQATVSDHSDWTVTMAWSGGGHSFSALSGIAMPFLYFRKSAGSVARVTVNAGTVTISNERLLIANSQGGANFVVYAPTGSTWTASGNVYTSTLNGKDYWSMAKLPPSGTPVATLAAAYQAYAYAFPVNTAVEWNYDEATSVVRTDFTITAEAMEGSSTTVLQGLLPHQWGYLAPDSALPLGDHYPSIRGTLKMLAGNHFATERTYHGILPTLPLIPDGSETLNLAALQEKVALLQNESLSTWTDSYNEGQVLNRLIQTARIADLMGDTHARDLMIETVRERLEDWLTAEPGEVAFLFYYNATWSAMIGYPAGHGQDGNLNDHHFHWGYFIHAASFVEQFQPGWAAGWGGMIDHLIRDAANPSRTDPQYPFLRNFSPYAGHSWANGFATFPFGNDQESSSESMQFASSLIHWGAVTRDDAVRDLGIYLYVTEQTATEEYWFDVNNRTLKPEYAYSLVSRIWGNGYDNQTFWTSDIAAAYGIELYPIHGGSLYLGHNHAYAEQLWAEMAANTGILSNQANVNLWHDVYWQFLALIDPDQAISLYDSYPDRSLKFGISDALTYHWIHSLKALGRVDATVTADYPIAATFRVGEAVTYVAHNYTDEPLLVSFSDGGTLDVAPRSMATSRDLAVRGQLSTEFNRAHPSGSLPVEVVIAEGTVDSVALYRGNTLLGTLTEEPYHFTLTHLDAGVHTLYARLHQGDRYSLSNSIRVQVGDQIPFAGVPAPIPGVIDAGHYDRFEGGLGQGIAYNDNSPSNEGGYRPEEFVDATLSGTEGAVVGWTSKGEWLEYTVDVEESGLHSVQLRYASGNAGGGGPVRLSVNGVPVSGWVNLPGTGGWSTFSAVNITGVPLVKGVRVLRLTFDGGEANVGRMTFARTGPLAEVRPIAHAGSNAFVQLPGVTALLDGSQSTVAPDKTVAHTWEQVYGPSVIQFSDTASAAPVLTNLVEGIYRVRLTVSDGTFEDFDEALVIVSSEARLPPTVSITQPRTPHLTTSGKWITISAAAQDLDGAVDSVAFYIGRVRIGQASTAPYSMEWRAPVGEYTLTAVATDNDGLSTTSSPVQIIVDSAPPCDGTHPNGDFSYVFSENASGQPTLTFIPALSGIGQTTLILYYNQTGSHPMPGYGGATPNVPFVLNAAAGDTIYFYYTYSHPQGGERNTMNALISHTIGECGEDYLPDSGMLLDAWRTAHFPAEILDDPSLEETVWGDRADASGDGFANFLKFFLNLDPLAHNGGGGIDWGFDGEDLVYLYYRRNDVPTALGWVEWSNNLATWSTSGLQETILHSEGGIDDVEVRLPEARSAAPVFLRLHVKP